MPKAQKSINVLNKTKCYLIGAMQYQFGGKWRDYVETEMAKIGVTCFNPYKKPFLKAMPEDEDARADLLERMKNGSYEYVHDYMRKVRACDLKLVDISDFLIAYIDPNIPTIGSIEEISVANRAKRPIFMAIEGGKKYCPLWIMGMLPPHYIYDSVYEAVETIKRIDSGATPIDSERWKLLGKEYR